MTSLAPSTPRLLDTSTVRGRLLVPILIFVGLLVAIVSSLGAPLIPTIAEQYRVPLSEAQWTVTITLLVGAITAPLIGRIADGPKRRTILIIALTVLVIGGVIAAIPGSFALLLAGRALQGIGLSLLPVVMSIARDHLSPERSGPAVATLSVTAVVGLGLGWRLSSLYSR